MLKEKLEYICEIAYYYGASGAYKNIIDRHPNSWLDYNDMVGFYEAIYTVALGLSDTNSLLDDIYKVINNEDMVSDIWENYTENLKIK